MKILLTGATGLIGRKLTYELLKGGHQVFALARNPEKLPELPSENVYQWSDQDPVPAKALSGVDAVIHLAGEGIADKKWSAARKKRLWDSRITGTKNLVQTMTTLSPSQRPKIFISGSAIGFYSVGNETLTESSPKGTGFLADLCETWEREALKSKDLGIRTILLRTGLVLAREGGVLAKSAPVVLGSGNQWMSWIHIEDMIALILEALQNQKFEGAINMTAPKPVTNREFTECLAKQMKVPITIGAPSFALKMVLGEMSQAVLSSQRVLPSKALELGYQFKFEDLESAMADLMGNWSILNNFFSAKQFVPLSPEEIFPFFGKAENLETLTPPFLNFHILKKSTPEIEKGSLIDYKLNIHGAPVKWRTLISEWSPGKSFVDEQLKGPYSKWHHIHRFEPVHGGTLIVDEVTFRIPGWIFGKAILPLIRHDVETIFGYRQKRIKELVAEGGFK